ncbi:MAG: redoxin domain-containing protein [Anaerolineaceae bacterium]|jgi:peroxiredoxin|nr:redoxin domain-containing protein [Anaerolineaceae bacterium]
MSAKKNLSKAIDFNLTDTKGRQIRLTDYSEKKSVLLVLMRGFA